MENLPPGFHCRLGPTLGIVMQSAATAGHPTYFTYGYRCGNVAPGDAVVCARTAKVALQLISQAPQNLGYRDPGLDHWFD